MPWNNDMNDLSSEFITKIKNVKVLCIDLDGVVIQGKELIPGAKPAIEKMEKMGYQIFFVTNNSAKSVIEIEEKLKALGIFVSKGHVINSISAAKELLDELDPKHSGRIMPLGSSDLFSEIEKTGRETVALPPCDYLLVGFDLEFNYEKISMASQAIFSGAQFIACNREANYPAEDGIIRPGCGAMVAAIEAAAQTSPNYIVGKPEINLLRLISKRFDYSPDEILCIGDTLESDIEMARRFSSPSVFIRRGRVISQSELKPTITVDYLIDLPDILEKLQINKEGSCPNDQYCNPLL